jgi:hypothetical protein
MYVVIGELQFMDVLLSIPPETIRMKQELIAEIAPRLQYSVPPLNMLRDRSDESPWDPPFVDAAEITLRGIFNRTTRLISGQSTGIPDMKNMTRLQLLSEYASDVFVKLPGEERHPYKLPAL